MNGRNLLALSEKDMRGVRGNDVSMIFQEPMTSLNPIFTIGRQISEVLIRHKGFSKQQARAETVRLLEKGSYSQRGRSLRRVSASVFRWHAPARDDRNGARFPAETADRR